ncbi:hypothetical protein J5N97_025777 [Dioscorea zingiberensis]|uniref:Uncharacterized protein n=1 Tax=Dioscorea zingiberensis TaxID=325984 RepID=A0A9D5H5Z4_9LILI|nr:hypothetical protein J5N97_025777 [Dioscorea zingiberensis]
MLSGIASTSRDASKSLSAVDALLPQSQPESEGIPFRTEIQSLKKSNTRLFGTIGRMEEGKHQSRREGGRRHQEREKGRERDRDSVRQESRRTEKEMRALEKHREKHRDREIGMLAGRRRRRTGIGIGGDDMFVNLI